MRRLWPLALLLAAVPAPAAAHVAASPDTNNRYLKLTPMAGRVRLSYTILIGGVPGAVARQVLDTDGDGLLSDAEADRWGRDVADKVRAGLDVTIDGRPVEVTWTEVYVGLGTPAVQAGSFSLDLIAWMCAPGGGGGGHQLELIDRFALNPAGETEVAVEGQPGVKISAVEVGGARAPDHHARFQGNAMPLADGLRVVYATDQPAIDDGRCPAMARPPTRQPRWPWVVGGLVALVMVVSLSLSGRRRRPG